MCGIAGLLSTKLPVTDRLLKIMTDQIQPRGPDASGSWVGPGGRVGLGHRRLAIIDLTEAGQQPMVSACGRYTVAYNGEIYNFEHLRRELEAAGHAPAWRGHSDTEVMLAVFSAFGVQAGLSRLHGMFALAVWDEQRRELILARDRFGEKPLYYGWTQAGFAFASTLAPIRATPGFDNPLSQQALACLMGRAYIPAPLSIYDGIAKLEPGCLLTLSCTALPGEAPRVERYFDYADQVLSGAATRITDQDEAMAALDEVLSGAVARQLVADVPVGSFLSGGFDSSLITAIAQRQASRPLKTFTIGFAEAGFDEAVHARRVAAALGTDHTEIYVSPSEAQAVIPQLPTIYDEPFADSSQIPTHLVSRLARQHVTVCLSGDGGDELFGGYNRHVQLPRVWRAIRRVPAQLRGLGLGTAGALPPRFWKGLSDLLRVRRSEWFGDTVQRAFRVMARAPDFNTLFDWFMDDWALQRSPLAGGQRDGSSLRFDPRLAHLPLEVQMMHVDAVTYLPDDILTKVDRAAMAVSLESRIPFLDPEVTALAARIDPSLNFARGGGKAILKELLYRYVPRELVDRPKAGFAIPVGVWLKGPLRDWAEDLLSERALSETGLLDPVVIRGRWARHLAGQEDATQPIWSVLMFQAWHKATS
jgi:asparagine synthase (glutamine-hydrolysing)